MKTQCYVHARASAEGAERGGEWCGIDIPAELTGDCERFAVTGTLRTVEVAFPWGDVRHVDPRCVWESPNGALLDVERALAREEQ